MNDCTSYPASERKKYGHATRWTRARMKAIREHLHTYRSDSGAMRVPYRGPEHFRAVMADIEHLEDVLRKLTNRMARLMARAGCKRVSKKRPAVLKFSRG